jgi:hypothetical protein
MQTGSPAYLLARIPHSKIKPYPKSALAALSDEQRVQLHAWLKKLPYSKIIKLMQEEWGFKTYSHVLSRYYHRYVAAEIIEERQRALGIATQLNKEIKARPCDYAEAILDGLGRRTTELSNEPEIHPRVLQIWVDMFNRSEELQLRKRILRVKERRLDLLEKQAEEARKTALDSELTDEEKAQRIRQILKLSFNEPDYADKKNGNGLAA